ncbi:MAG: hypothetical protein K2N60_12915 [Oscillospiraceae bacterium]|nr:hypothetical protein [Oscillospiraceae bacterium]
MSKSTGIFKYIVLNIFMAGLTAAFLFTELLCPVAFLALVGALYCWWISVPLLFFMNWLAYRFVDDNVDERKGVIFAALGGFIGGFAAVHTKNKDYEKRTSINVIFNIWLYIAIIYPIMVGILFLTGYYSML